MTSITIDPQIASKSDASRQFLSRLRQALRPLDDGIRDGELTKLMADALAQDPLEAESAVRNVLFEKARNLLARPFEHLDDCHYRMNTPR